MRLIIIIIKKEIMKRIYDFRFIIFITTSIILAAFLSFLFSQRYKWEIQNINQINKQVHENMNLESMYVILPPNSFSFFDASEENFFKRIRLEPNIIFYSEPFKQNDQTFTIKHDQFDLMFIIIYVFSFFSIILVYDSIAGEKEKGVLKLIMSNSVSRIQYILGSILGNLFIILTALLIMLLICFLIVNLISPYIQFQSQDWMKILITTFSSCLFIGFIVLISLLGSVLFKKSSIALIFNLLIWMLIVVAIPIIINIISEYLRPIPSIRDLQSELRSAEIRKFESTGLDGMKILNILKNKKLSSLEKKKCFLELQSETYKKNILAIEEYSITSAQILEDYINRLISQTEFSRKIGLFCPPLAFKYSVQAILPSGYERQKIFIDSTKKYFLSFNEAITKLRNQHQQEANLTQGFTELTDNGIKYRLYNIEDISFKNVKFDKNKIPEFSMIVPSLNTLLNNAIPRWGSLLIYIIIIISLIYYIFVQYDVR